MRVYYYMRVATKEQLEETSTKKAPEKKNIQGQNKKRKKK